MKEIIIKRETLSESILKDVVTFGLIFTNYGINYYFFDNSVFMGFVLTLMLFVIFIVKVSSYDRVVRISTHEEYRKMEKELFPEEFEKFI